MWLPRIVLRRLIQLPLNLHNYRDEVWLVTVLQRLAKSGRAETPPYGRISSRLQRYYRAKGATIEALGLWVEEDDGDGAGCGCFGVFGEARIGVDELLVKGGLLGIRGDFGAGGHVLIHNLKVDLRVGL